MLIHRKPTIIVVTGPIPTSSRSCPGTNFINEDQYYIIWRTSIKEKKPKEGDNIVQDATADIPPLLQLKCIYYELMIQYVMVLNLK